MHCKDWQHLVYVKNTIIRQRSNLTCVCLLCLLVGMPAQAVSQQRLRRRLGGHPMECAACLCEQTAGSNFDDLQHALRLQIQLMTRLAKLEEVEGTAVRDTFRLLVDDAAPVRHAAAELVADLLPDFGERQLQVNVHACDCF